MKSSFFHSILIMVMIGLHNAACKNSIDTPPVSYTKLEVQEYKTNFPIPGAEVKIYECTKQGFGGCAELSLRKTVTADTAFVIQSFGYRNNLVYWYFTDAIGNEDSIQTRGQLPAIISIGS
jgi:hypothetical protein